MWYTVYVSDLPNYLYYNIRFGLFWAMYYMVLATHHLSLTLYQLSRRFQVPQPQLLQGKCPKTGPPGLRTNTTQRTRAPSRISR